MQLGSMLALGASSCWFESSRFDNSLKRHYLLLIIMAGSLISVSSLVCVAAATAVILPSHSYFQSRGLHLSGYGHSVHSHSSRTYTGYSLSHSSHSGLHAAVVGRVANVAVVFCHCKSDLSQFTHSEYNALGCRIKDRGHSRVCM